MTTRRIKSSKAIPAVQAGTVALLCALWLALPGSPWWTVPAMALIYCVAYAVYRRTAQQSAAGAILLTVAALMLGAGVIANVYYFTTVCGGTDSSPVLLNPDAARNWNDALATVGLGGSYYSLKHSFYGQIIAVLEVFAGPSVTVMTLPSMALIMGSLLCCSVISGRIGLDRWTCAMAMGVCMAICYFMSMGTVILKEAWVIFAISLAGVGFVSRGISRPCIIVAILMLTPVRPEAIGFVILGLAATVICQWETVNRKRLLLTAICLMAIGAVLWYIMAHLEFMPNAVGRIYGPGDEGLYIHQQQYAYYNLLGYYNSWPIWKKILMMPLTACVQFVIPFPWNYGRDLVFGYTQVYAHVAYPWYLMGALIVYFVATMKRRPRNVLFICILGILFWLVPAYTSGGSISRYGLLAVPYMAPAAANVLATDLRRRSLWIWLGSFTVIMASVLLAAHYLQTSAQTLNS